jgi:outer membrane protein OmpU
LRLDPCGFRGFSAKLREGPLWQDCTNAAPFRLKLRVEVAIKGCRGEKASYPIRKFLDWAAPLDKRGKPMKKILLATTVLAATAGYAAAEVKLSGDARVGFQKVEGQDTTMERRTRVKFSASGESDNGLSFGMSFRPQGALAAEDGNANNTGNVYVSGAFGTLSIGSESSAAEYAVGDLAGVGFTGAGSKNETTFIGTANTAFVYTYSAGAVTAMVSGGEAAGVGGNKLSSKNTAVGVKYSAGDLTLGLGYEKAGANNNTVVGATYVMGDTTVKAIYGNTKVAATAAVAAVPTTLSTAGVLTVGSAAVDATAGMKSQMGASVSHKMGAITLSGFYRSVDDAAGVSSNYSGIGAAYDFGGGLAAKAGYADNAGVSTIEAGLNFSF